MIPEDYNMFSESLKNSTPESTWSTTLIALWWDAKGDWDKAHSLVDGSAAEYANWIHAYLHRKEGDEWNAGYWYRRANRPFPKQTLEEEFKTIVKYLLAN